jgi:SAM-dependent methyltransferase
MKTQPITLIKDEKESRKILFKFIEQFWYAPQDAFLRATEALIWSKKVFAKPVLEVGTGDGRYSELLFSANKYFDVGIDIDEKAIKIAKKTGFYKIVRVSDSANLSFKNDSFATVISNSTFEHVKDDIKSISEVSRVLKRGGIFYLTVPTPRLEKYLAKLGLNKDEINRYNTRVEHLHYRSYDDWEKLFKKHNLSLFYHHYYLPFEAVKTWYLFHRISTFKLYKRELWSYVKDSPYGKLIPKNLAILFLKGYLFPKFVKLFDKSGAWQYIVAVKK